jgi:hypothetical protein
MMKKSLLRAASALALALALSLGVTTVAMADVHPGNGGAEKPAAVPLLQVDAAILATGERVKDLSDMRNPLPE